MTYSAASACTWDGSVSRRRCCAGAVCCVEDGAAVGRRRHAGAAVARVRLCGLWGRRVLLGRCCSGGAAWEVLLGRGERCASVTRGSSKAVAVECERYFLATSQTSSSISHIVTLATSGWRQTCVIVASVGRVSGAWPAGGREAGRWRLLIYMQREGEERQEARRASRRTPPSPPPTMRTDCGLGCEWSGSCAIISWYACSSRSVS